ncbi:MAG: chromate transporter [Solobacterium sp.]|nr:chromate transporter [Solobacterium sp.]
MQFLLMCWEFFKTGLFAVGGGLATIPFLQDMANRYGWFTIQDLSTMIAISESTPGPIGVNMATYIGNHMYGFVGGVATTLSLVAPSVIVVCIIAKILERFKESKVIKGIFEGLRPSVVGLILAAVLSIYISSLLQMDTYSSTKNLTDLFNIKAILLFGIMLVFYKWKEKTHPIVFIVFAAVCGILFHF